MKFIIEICTPKQVQKQYGLMKPQTNFMSEYLVDQSAIIETPVHINKNRIDEPETRHESFRESANINKK